MWTLTAQEKKLLKRRQAIEPAIGHLKGELSDSLHAVLCAAGYNIRWLLRMIAKKGVAFLWQLYLRLCSGLAQVSALLGNWDGMAHKFMPIALLPINTR